MNLINEKKINQIVNEIPVLKDLNELILDTLDSSRIISQKNKFLNDNIGLIKLNNNETIKNILLARKFFYPSAIYGHRYGKNINTELSTKRNHLSDFFSTDINGLLKNDLSDQDISEKIKCAKENNIELIYFFGGSTMMGMGSGTPNFSIPSLVEKIFKLKYKKEIICINYGLGGTCSREALDLYIHEVRTISKSAKVIFYDGWNCASYLTATKRFLKSENPSIKNLVSNGDTLRTIDHNYTLSKKFSLKWHLRYSFQLLIAKIFNLMNYIFPKKIMNVLSKIQKKFFTLSSFKFLLVLTNILKTSSDLEIKNAVNEAVKQYIDIHRCIFLLSESNFIWIQQPTVFWGNKPLTKNEMLYKSSALSSGDPRIFNEFEKTLNNDFKLNLNDKLKSSFHDLTKAFDNVENEVYIDSGHINKFGNLIISASIAEIIFKQKNFLR